MQVHDADGQGQQAKFLTLALAVSGAETARLQVFWPIEAPALALKVLLQLVQALAPILGTEPGENHHRRYGRQSRRLGRPARSDSGPGTTTLHHPWHSRRCRTMSWENMLYGYANKTVWVSQKSLLYLSYKPVQIIKFSLARLLEIL